MDGRRSGFLGTGWAFPPSFSRGAGGARMVSGEADIHQSLAVLFSTAPGERVMVPEYGCQLDRFVFDRVTTTWATQVRGVVQQAIVLWEPRIELLGVTVDISASAAGKVMIGVDYRVRTTNVRSNYVYPFYVREASLPQAG